MKIPFDNSYSSLPEGFFIRVDPVPVRAPSLIHFNKELSELLGIDPAFLESPEGLAVLSGCEVAAGSDPVALAYSGHQFGNFVPQLGDGRAVLIGELVGRDGVRRELQLKGSGRTPFSRGGDGRSALGPVVREFLVSEAMHALGVPTTRALSIVSTGEPVMRESPLPGGVMLRVAQSHWRVGTFQWFASRGDLDGLRKLVDLAIARHDPAAAEAEYPVRAFLEGVIRRQAELVAHWMQLGFIHGVMNTDNMSISGETIDFGPCAFLDAYHPGKKFSSIDHRGRYAFANQGSIAHWNLTRLAETLLPLLDEDSKRAIPLAEGLLDRFPDLHVGALQHRFLAKIGLESGSASDWEMMNELLRIMAEQTADFTLTFRHLAAARDPGQAGPFLHLFDSPEAVEPWLKRWRERVQAEATEKVRERMQAANPVYIPRNHRVEAAIQAAYAGDWAPFHRLREVLARPFEDRESFEEYEKAPQPEEVVRATFCGT